MKQGNLIEKALQQAQAELASLADAHGEARAKVSALQAALSTTSPPISAVRLPVVAETTLPKTAAEKVRLFRALFRGRMDVFPRRWENAKLGKSGYAPACGNEWVRGVCEKPKVKCSECPNQAFLAVDDQVILDHLNGKHVVGVYPLLQGDTCWFVAADFDEESWREDVVAFAETCRTVGLPVALERSRSGNGAHAWFFFDDAVPAVAARNLASFLLTETMARCRELSLRSYDRLFPSQDVLPRGGFGNLIALPFQRGPRQAGNSLFLDASLVPYPWDEQWRFLASLPRLSAERTGELAREAARTGRVLGVGFPGDQGDDDDATQPWNRPPPGQEKPAPLHPSPPDEVRAVLAQGIFVEKTGLPSGLLGRFKRLAAFQNPEFYRRQRFRLSTARIPRIISCSEDLPQHLVLPRGCVEALAALLTANRSRLAITDAREGGKPLACRFEGTLTPVQESAARALLAHETGVLVAPPGSGKTVIGTRLIAERATSTLVLVHRRPLLDQWVNQIAMFTGEEPASVGQIAGGRRKANGRLDVAMIQSLIRDGVVDASVATYGHVIVDECHHVPAVSFESVLKQVKARYMTGLTATPRRRDGHHPIAEMQLGPVRFEIDARAQAEARPFAHKLIVRETDFACEAPDAKIQDLYRALAVDGARNEMILRDVARALDDGRVPLVLTERKDHLEALADLLAGVCRRVIVLRGGLSAGETRAATERLARTGRSAERVLVATGRYIGEGFDDPSLDTLFLTMPISWKGTLIQYAGRIQRLHPEKREVRIYDYVDRRVPMLARMFDRRLRGYRSIGYQDGEMPAGLSDADDDFVLGRGWDGANEEEEAGGEEDRG